MSRACMRRWIRRNCAARSGTVNSRVIIVANRLITTSPMSGSVASTRSSSSPLMRTSSVGFDAHRLREAARQLLEQRGPAEDVAFLQDLRRLARVRTGPERVLDLAGDDDVEVVRVVADLVEDRALRRTTPRLPARRSCAAGRPLPPAAASSAAGSRRRIPTARSSTGATGKAFPYRSMRRASGRAIR